MAGARFETENVARQQKRADLAPSVGQQFVGPNRASNNLVDIVGRLVLAVDFFIFAVRRTRSPQGQDDPEQAEQNFGRADNRNDLGRAMRSV